MFVRRRVLLGDGQQRRGLFLILLVLGQELTGAVPNDGIPPSLVSSSEGKLVLKITAPKRVCIAKSTETMAMVGLS